jgi:two-component system, cell cycle response regulator
MSESSPTARLLLVDASRASSLRASVQSRLEGGGFDVARATAAEAKRLLGEAPPDLLVLLGPVDEAEGGLLAESKRLRDGDGFVPVLVLLPEADAAARVRLLRGGADECLDLPVPDEEMVARIEALLRIKRIQDRMHRSRQDLQRLTVTDALTGVLNRKHLEERCRDELKRARRYRDPLSLLVVDLDGFRTVNEAHGEEVGSEVLKAFARLLGEEVRDVDLLGRLSADTFCLLLPSTHLSGALTVAERISASIAGGPFHVRGRAIPLTATVGLAFFPSREVATHEDLLRLAREALYRARQEGRGRIGLYQGTHYTYEPEAEPEAEAGAGIDGKPGAS